MKDPWAASTLQKPLEGGRALRHRGPRARACSSCRCIIFLLLQQMTLIQSSIENVEKKCRNQCSFKFRPGYLRHSLGEARGSLAATLWGKEKKKLDGNFWLIFHEPQDSFRWIPLAPSGLLSMGSKLQCIQFKIYRSLSYFLMWHNAEASLKKESNTPL